MLIAQCPMSMFSILWIKKKKAKKTKQKPKPPKLDFRWLAIMAAGIVRADDKFDSVSFAIGQNVYFRWIDVCTAHTHTHNKRERAHTHTVYKLIIIFVKAFREKR